MSSGWNFGTGTPDVNSINKGLFKYAQDNGFAQNWGGDNMDPLAYQRNLGDTGVTQAKFNRPSTSGPFGSSTVDANGNVTSAFSGGFGTLNDNLTTQAANVAANPMDWGQFGTLGTGEDAGRETAQATYNQSLSRLNPFWEKSEKKLRTNLFQSGMGDSTAGDTSVGEFGQARNDAYAGAMTNAMQAGMGAQQNVFNGNLASRQQGVANALRGQMQPFEELNGMKSFLTQPQVGRDNSMLMRDSAVNQMAPLLADADKETATQARAQSIHGDMFRDQPGDARPGGGQRRLEKFKSLSPEMQEFITRYAGVGSSMPDPG
jgi:hypothetical protein